MAGVSRLQYASDIRLIRVMCSGRVDLEFVLRAFSKGMDGVLIGGCRLNECNYVTHGNYHAFAMVHLCQKLMAHMGLNPERLRIEFMSAGDGILLAEVISDFNRQIREMGPLGKAEGIDEAVLYRKLEAASRLVPYIRLVERERLRIPVMSEKAYRDFFASDAFDRLFNELIGDRLAIGQIVSLLLERPLSTGQISETLGLNPSDVSRHMKSSSRQGLVRFDESEKRYALA